MSLFSSWFAELFPALLRNAEGAELPRADELPPIPPKPGFAVVGNQSHFNIVVNAKTCKSVLNKVSLLQVGHV